MKSDTERKIYYNEKLHKRKSRLHVHLSKDLRGKLKAKKRAILVRQGDTVRVMRGPGKGKDAKVGQVSVLRRKVFLEGVTVKNLRGKEVPVPVEPSNLLLISLEPTKERKEIFSEDAFRKKEAKKEPAKEAPKAEAKAASEQKPHEHTEHRHETGHEHAPKAQGKQ
jgi:large subunit ribosomal protein L24